MNHKILIVEDDTDINNLLEKILKSEGYEVIQAFSGTEARLCAEHHLPDLILLDLMLPGMTGEDFLQFLRDERHCDNPVLILSAKNTLHDKITLLKAGADDYITKPFEPEEVTARVQSALRRSGLAAKSGGVRMFSCRNLKLYPELRKVTVHDKELTLTGKEYDILYLLIQNPGKVFSRENLYAQVWQDGYYGADHTVNVHISNLRKKLKEFDPDQEYIQAVYGIGFRLKNAQPES